MGAAITLVNVIATKVIVVRHVHPRTMLVESTRVSSSMWLHHANLQLDYFETTALLDIQLSLLKPALISLDLIAISVANPVVKVGQAQIAWFLSAMDLAVEMESVPLLQSARVTLVGQDQTAVLQSALMLPVSTGSARLPINARVLIVGKEWIALNVQLVGRLRTAIAPFARQVVIMGLVRPLGHVTVYLIGLALCATSATKDGLNQIATRLCVEKAVRTEHASMLLTPAPALRIMGENCATIAMMAGLDRFVIPLSVLHPAKMEIVPFQGLVCAFLAGMELTVPLLLFVMTPHISDHLHSWDMFPLDRAGTPPPITWLGEQLMVSTQGMH
jgi:hypothetical protein